MRLNAFTFRFAGLVAALLFVAACETTPGSGAGSSGGGRAGVGGATAPQPGTQEDLVVNVGDRVFFGYDKYNLDAKDRGAVERQAAWLKRFPATTVTVEGHCDERGTREYNLALGERRANSVRNYLVALGVDNTRIKIISYGKERPVALGSNDASWGQNRRGVLTVN